MGLRTMSVTLIKLPERHWNAIACAGSVAKQLNMRAYIAGGFVRDMILGTVSDDMDIAVSGDPYEYGTALASAIGGKFVSLHEEPKIARIVKRYNNEQLQLDITGIKTSIEDDLLSRDFTINSLAIPIETIRRAKNSTKATLQFPDASSCYDDLIRGVIRMHSGIESKLILDDPVRMLRAFRFAATLGFKIDESLLSAIEANSSLIANCSWERIRDEFASMLQSYNGSRMLGMMDEVGLLGKVLPELESLKCIPAGGYHHLDGFRHSVESVRFIEMLISGTDWIEEEWRDIGVALHGELKSYIEHQMNPIVERRTRLFALKMAALLHDVGKPLTMSRNSDGDLHFFKHEVRGAETSEQICKRLRLSNRETHLIVQTVRWHMYPLWLARGESLSDRTLRRFWIKVGEQVGTAIIFVSLADMLATRGVDMTLEEMTMQMKVLLELIKVQKRLKELQAYPKLLSGHDVMKRYGIPQGPIVGKALHAVREAQLEGRVRTKEEAFLLLDKLLPSLLSRKV
ncbi:MAG: HD domain-containing protein [Armatimonadota bacterium]|nr:HD domain-containing protein [Armatimonadota bacterium]MCX7777483.1 HD domain-containing protein [Armatimonadota bacterium]MDW8025508.1 HD domain-containing protein [Armatimonadota bacterium]